MANQTIQRPGKYTDDLAQSSLEEGEAPSQAKDESEKKPPMERWREALAAADLTEAEADKILDSVLATGTYEKSYKIFRGRLTVTLRSRDSASLQRVSDALDAVKTNDSRVHLQTMNRYNLAASIVRYQDKVFKHPPPVAESADREKAFYERLVFIDTIPAPVLVQLYAVLGKFDSIVYAALSEGAEMGF